MELESRMRTNSIAEDVEAEQEQAEPVQLEPFLHQVGGHSSMLCLDERTVCKPLIKQELLFYQTLPVSMKPFTPEFRGTVKVRFEQDADGCFTVAACPPKSLPYQLNNSHKKSRRRRIRLKSSGSIEIESYAISGPQGTHSASTSGPSVQAQPQPIRIVAHNPWVLKCHRDQLAKLRTTPNPSVKDKEPRFMLLENLTSRFTSPCIMDLKMGTRQYGDDATPEKIEAQSAKAASSTSGQLGVRICGMQVFQPNPGKFLCRNKYYGRQLGIPGFRQGVAEFLDNGTRLRVDIVKPLVDKLEALQSVLSTLDTYRFYTSSLLLIYEGSDPCCSGGEVVSLEHQGSQDSTTTSDDVFSTSNNRQSDPRAADPSLPKRSRVKSSLSLSGQDPAVTLAPLAVDVRLIDFAHATHSKLTLGTTTGPGPKEHSGPDAGFIFGLSNLIQILRDTIAENDNNVAAAQSQQ